MNTISTALTRPSTSSGVTRGRIVCRSTTDTMSTAPPNASAASDSHIVWESPKTTMLAPNSATTSSSRGPARRRTGHRARIRAAVSDPTAGAVRSTPRPTGPTSSTSFANTGSSATAPPKRTAKRSSEMAPNSTGVRRISRTPASRLSRPGAPLDAPVRPDRIASTHPADTSVRPTATAYTSSGRIENSSPPAAGPATTDTWNAIERCARAVTRISSGTSDGVNDRPAGEPSAAATPVANASARNCHSSCAPPSVTASRPANTGPRARWRRRAACGAAVGRRAGPPGARAGAAE